MKKTTLSFGKRVRIFLKQGSVTKTNKFYREIKDVISDKTETINKQIKRLKKKIKEEEEKYLDAIFNIDIDKLNSVDNRINYAKEYVNELCNFKGNNIWDLEVELEQLNSELKIILSFQADLETLEPKVEVEDDE